jgi:ATP-dependent 26S proteasome regulatory subunit
VAAKTDGFAGADLAAVCDHARLLALRGGGFGRHQRVAPGDLVRAARELRTATERPPISEALPGPDRTNDDTDAGMEDA